MTAGGDFVIFVEYGGLGDHLFFSHIPRIAKEAGYRVLVSNRSAFRSPEIRRLVWEMNPHVSGFTDAAGFYKPAFDKVPPGMNILDRKMLEMGLDDGRRMHEPEVYYTPAHRTDVADKTVLDPNFVSFVGHIVPGALGAYLAREKMAVDAQLTPRDKAADRLAGAPMVATRDLFDYCDLIHSCGRFLCFTSGGATLAAALKKPAIAFYGPGQLPMFHHSVLHTYVELSASSPDKAGD